MIKISGRHAVSGRWGFQPVCFLVTQHLPGNRNISFQTRKVIRRNAIHGMRITNRVMTISAERIQSSQNAPGLALNLPSGSTSAGAMSVGWNFPLAGHVTTGRWWHGVMTAPRP